MDQTDLTLLAHLDALLQESNVTAAARRLGLSTPAMSHALARLRERLGDPLLVRSGRSMVLTPRAQALKPRVQAALEQAREAMAPERPFVVEEVARTFVLCATDYVTTVLGPALDQELRARAPGLCLRVAPNALHDAESLRDGSADLAVGIYGPLPPELRCRTLLTDRFVCVVREGHPRLQGPLTLAQFVAEPHLQVAPRAQPGGYLDDTLRALGLSRQVALAVPSFLGALYLASQSDHLLTVSERVAERLAPTFGLRLLEPPLELRPYALSLLWHPRSDADPAHRFLREALLRAARKVAGEAHPQARTRLDTSDPTSGQARKRPRQPRAKG